MLDSYYSAEDQLEQKVEEVDKAARQINRTEFNKEGQLEIYASCLVALINSANEHGITLQELLAALPEE
jgi:hypothetical protein